MKVKKYRKVRDHCHCTEEYRGGTHNIFILKYSVSKKMSIVFHNESHYGNHFISKKLEK